MVETKPASEDIDEDTAGYKKENLVTTQHDKRSHSEIEPATESTLGGLNPEDSEHSKSHTPRNDKDETNPFAEYQNK